MFCLPLVRVAHADSCVVVDEQKDTLSPEDRRAAAISLQQALMKNGVQVSNQNCLSYYTVYHVKLGNTISVYLYGPGGVYREGRANKVDEIPMVHEQLVSAMLNNKAVSESVDRTNATTDQMAPRRVEADNVKILRLGYGGVTGNGSASGPAFGVGWRFELDRLSIEVSAFNFLVATNSSTNGTGFFTGDWIRLSGYYYGNPTADATWYTGIGLGWGGTFGGNFDSSQPQAFGGSGLQVDPVIGYEMLRSSTIRLFFEATLTLPLYTDGNGNWLPSGVLQVGIGWGKSNTIAVINR
jgi:hypothetical protein